MEAGLKPVTSGHVTKSADDAFYDEILDEHRGQEQIAFNCWVKRQFTRQFTKALTKLQKRFRLKNKKEAMVQGVIYAASAINRGAEKQGSGGRQSKKKGSA